MPVERYIKRTVYEAKCDCGAEPVIRADEHIPRARLCQCGKWVDYIAKSAVGPDLNLPGYK